jgi:hypothetical protein
LVEREKAIASNQQPIHAWKTVFVFGLTASSTSELDVGHDLERLVILSGPAPGAVAAGLVVAAPATVSGKARVSRRRGAARSLFGGPNIPKS